MQDGDKQEENQDALSRIISAAFGPTDRPDDHIIDSILDGTTAGSSTVRELTRDLEDRYELLTEISRGGMGIVWKANDRALGRRVAVKTLTDRGRRHAGMRERLIEEARICGRLEHPGIVPLHDFGFLPSGDPFMVMRLVEGETLADLLERRSTADEDQLRLVKVFERICTATAHAHERGFLHRDLKPSNVMVGAYGETQVMDWGLARSIRPSDPAEAAPSAAARRGSVVGTASYMSPEQARGAVDLDARCDVFSLGAILFEILTGRRVFVGSDNEETLRLATNAELAPAWAALGATDADPELVALVRRCLEPNRFGRPANGSVVAGEVARYLSRLTERQREAEIATAAARAKAAEERRGRRVTVTLTVLLAAMVVLAGAVWVWLDSDRREREEESRRRASVALERAIVLRDQARSASRSTSAERWTEAAAAAQEALDLVPHDGSRRALADIVAEKERHAAMVALELEFEDLRPHIADDRTFTAIDGGLRRAFGELDIDVDGLDVEVSSERMKSSPIRATLVSVLDDWTEFRRRRIGDEAKADRLMEIAILVDDHPWRNRVRRAVAARDLEALRKIAASNEVDDAAPARLDLVARALYWAGDQDESIRLYRWANIKFPSDARLAHNLAVFLKAQPDPPRAEIARLLGSAVSLEPDNAHFRADLGFALGRSGDIEGALAVFAWLQEHRPQYARGWFLRGSVLADLGRVEEAIAAFAQATRTDVTWARAWSNHGSMLAKSGRVGESFEALEREQTVNPDVSEEPIGLVQVRLRHLRDSIPALLRAIHDRPGDPGIHGELGTAYLQLGRIPESIHHLRAGLEADDESVEMWVNLALACSVSGDYESALDAAENAYDIDEQSMNAIYVIGTSLFHLGMFDESRIRLGRAINMGYVPGGGFMTPRVGLRDVEAARKVEARAASLRPGETLPRRDRQTLAKILAFRGRHADSVREFQASLRPRRHLVEPFLIAARTAVKAAREVEGDTPSARARRTEYLVQARKWVEDGLGGHEWHPSFHFWAAYFHADTELSVLRTGPLHDSLDADERERWDDIQARLRALLPVIEE